MKKLFTLVALLAMVLGANAQTQWEEVYKIDYSTLSGFPNYVMSYVPEWIDGVMTDYGADYRYATQNDLDGDGDNKWKDGESSVGTTKTNNGVEYQKVTGAGPYWHQYIIAADVPMLIDETYKVKAVIKASAGVNPNLQFGNWGSLKETSVSIPESTEFQEVEWLVEGCTYGGNGFICIQPGTSTATIEWKSVTVEHKLKPNQRPKEWLEDLDNGNAETPWTDAQKAIKFNDQENNFTICAWSKEKGRNMNENDGWDPFPSDIELEEGTENHVFVCHGQPATTEGDASAWDNQFWIQSKHAWKAGTALKIKFRYKCDYAGGSVKTNTQVHKQNPSDYLIWHAIGDITFTNDWQTFDGTMTIADDMANGWSIAFNLNPNVKDAVNFYFDDLSWQYLKLDEGYFISGINSNTADSYDDLDNAIQFEWDEEAAYYVATFGEKGNAASYVDQIMISTTRGDDQAFKGATLKPQGKIKNDPEDWQEYSASTNAKLDLPGLGVWKVYLDTEYKSMAFEMLEGTAYEEPEPVDIVTNATEMVVNGTERDWKPAKEDGTPQDGEEGIGTGQPWDNQFWIAANRNLKKGEVTILKFKYKSSVDAKTTTQCHKMGDDNKPCTYLHWAAIGDVNFAAGDWVDFEKEFTVADEADGMRSIVFNMAEIKAACDYSIKDVQWYLKDENNADGKTFENLINADGTENFWVKVAAGNPYPYGTDPAGISTVKANVSNNAVIYNLAGQRVSKDYKGIVVKDNKKVVLK
jgi:hypothetical protein